MGGVEVFVCSGLCVFVVEIWYKDGVDDLSRFLSPVRQTASSAVGQSAVSPAKLPVMPRRSQSLTSFFNKGQSAVSPAKLPVMPC